MVPQTGAEREHRGLQFLVHVFSRDPLFCSTEYKTIRFGLMEVFGCYFVGRQGGYNFIQVLQVQLPSRTCPVPKRHLQGKTQR